MPHPFLTDADKAWPANTYFYSDSSTDTGQVINLEPYQTTVVINLSDGTNTATALLNLPPVSKCAGVSFSIVARDAAGGATVRTNTGASFDDSPDWTDLVLDTDDDLVVLYSDGDKWTVIENRIA